MKIAPLIFPETSFLRPNIDAFGGIRRFPTSFILAGCSSFLVENWKFILLHYFYINSPRLIKLNFWLSPNVFLIYPVKFLKINVPSLRIVFYCLLLIRKLKF